MMRIITPFLILILVGCNSATTTIDSGNIYPDESERTLSKEQSTYYIDPVSGSDANIGTEKESPWKTFKRVNQLILTKGNSIEILAPGAFRESLYLIGKGTTEAPIVVQFAKGEYDFYPKEFFKNKFHISNANDAPDSLKSVAFYLYNSENVKLKGVGAEINFRGKTIQTSLNNCSNISVEDLSFDYKRPTVSELLVLNVAKKFADVQIHTDSNYEIVDSTLVWVGEGWKHNAQDLWQEFNPETQQVSRKHIPVSTMRFSELETNKVRIHFDKKSGFTKGLVYQNRNTFRDYASIFMQKSKNILWKNVTIHFMHGMGIVSQFSENLTFDSLVVAPKVGSGRTCAAWADILHFSGCKGEIQVLNSYLSAANDDAINVHGTHLRITDSIASNKIKVRFMHPQTYGFEAFFIGDSIEFIRAKTLLPYSKNVISKINILNEKEVELELEKNIPRSIAINDVIENSSWTANVTIKNNKIVHIPTRGILTTTRGKIVIDNNEFFKTAMSAILISDDANSWFESGYVKDVTISNNKFIDCGGPVLNIHPENSVIIEGEPVHSNIAITNNQFFLGSQQILSAKSTGNITFATNNIRANKNLNTNQLIHTKSCVNVQIFNNKLNDKVITIPLKQ
ncbi:right-handed parallel beta-helix repeat-containing protein [Cellulophaga sp. F20128]|uniref:right-handed parallel beta-helix repeat-containing protein n=1 Tax=Cellulophaga sp. F20128 TaxID=2926413 RepID=UPI001FF37DFF|nr:right-handed parallel beta-helix repeat-containing protein [Cellulophaga sp. F20128]MCK0158281.1 right-handed parallel beta-helix repeat-containing protein [Cellulophaga sp. F20128]